MAYSLIALGANLGDREATLRAAFERLASAGLKVVAQSRLHSTAPIGGPPDQPSFLNAAAIIESPAAPRQILEVLLSIEKELARVRDQRWAARTLDLDLLLCGDQRIEEPDLIVPHPRMAFRRFVLAPAAEIAADWIHPEIGWSLGKLLQHIDFAANYAAICDTPDHHGAHLAATILKDCDCALLSLDFRESAANVGENLHARVAKANTLLQQTALPAPHERWLVSDFWFADGIALARAAGLPNEQVNELQRFANITELPASVPKLLIVPQLGEINSAYDAAVQDVINQEHVGPVLRVSAHDLEQAAIEARAALRAMRLEKVTEF